MVQDTEKRLEFLFDRLAQELVPEVVLARLVLITKDLQTGNIQRALDGVMALLSVSGDFSDEAKWIVALKRLVEHLRK